MSLLSCGQPYMGKSHHGVHVLGILVTVIWQNLLIDFFSVLGFLFCLLPLFICSPFCYRLSVTLPFSLVMIISQEY